MKCVGNTKLFLYSKKLNRNVSSKPFDFSVHCDICHTMGGSLKNFVQIFQADKPAQCSTTVIYNLIRTYHEKNIYCRDSRQDHTATCPSACAFQPKTNFSHSSIKTPLVPSSSGISLSAPVLVPVRSHLSLPPVFSIDQSIIWMPRH